jgi:hypothetical protein
MRLKLPYGKLNLMGVLEKNRANAGNCARRRRDSVGF